MEWEISVARWNGVKLQRLSRTPSAKQHPRLIQAKGDTVARHSKVDGVWSWRAALLLMFAWCLFAWIGIGLLIGKFVG